MKISEKIDKNTFRFLEDSSRVISTGGKDATVMQWTVES